MPKGTANTRVSVPPSIVRSGSTCASLSTQAASALRSIASIRSGAPSVSAMSVSQITPVAKRSRGCVICIR